MNMHLFNNCVGAA